jgi:hypothetical protein
MMWAVMACMAMVGVQAWWGITRLPKRFMSSGTCRESAPEVENTGRQGCRVACRCDRERAAAGSAAAVVWLRGLKGGCYTTLHDGSHLVGWKKPWFKVAGAAMKGTCA